MLNILLKKHHFKQEIKVKGIILGINYTIVYFTVSEFLNNLKKYKERKLINSEPWTMNPTTLIVTIYSTSWEKSIDFFSMQDSHDDYPIPLNF